MTDQLSDENVKKRLIEFAPDCYIEDDMLGIVERVQAYDPNLRVQFLDPARGSDITDAPYRIVEMCPDGLPRVVFSVWDLDERVMERLYRADNHRGNILQGLDGTNLLAEKNQKRRYDDEQAALHEMVRDTLRSPKEKYTATNPVTGQKHEFKASPESKD